MRAGDRVNKYKKITKEQRLQAIELVLDRKMNIKAAADILGLGVSTVRMIVRKY